jgi:hypothetical protein
MTRLEFKSPADGSLLVFEVTERQPGETMFDVEVRTPRFSGRVPASTYVHGAPAVLFREMANDWAGWTGEKSWTDLESNVELTATTDRLGHVSLRIRLTGDGGEPQLSACLNFDAGQLALMADDIEQLFC